MARSRTKTANEGDALSKTNRLAAEAERQAQARTTRDQLAAETLAAQKATAKRLKDKPTDTRTLVA